MTNITNIRSHLLLIITINFVMMIIPSVTTAQETESNNEKSIMWIDDYSKAIEKNESNSTKRHLHKMNQEMISAIASEEKIIGGRGPLSIQEDIFNKYFGNPKIDIHDYDYDSEILIIRIISSAFSYHIDANYKTPMDTIDFVEADITGSRPTIYFSVKDNVIEPNSITFETSDKEIMLDTTIGSIPILIGNDALVTLTKELEKEDEARRKDAAEKNARYQQKLKNARIQRASAHANWPNNTIAKINYGGVICLSLKSAYKASAIRRANNPYVSFPDDCVETSKDGYAVSVNHLQGGISKVLMYGATASGYTLSHDIKDR